MSLFGSVGTSTLNVSGSTNIVQRRVTKEERNHGGPLDNFYGYTAETRVSIVTQKDSNKVLNSNPKGPNQRVPRDLLKLPVGRPLRV